MFARWRRYSSAGAPPPAHAIACATSTLSAFTSAQCQRSQRLHLRNANALTIYIVGQPPDPAQAMLTSPPPSVAFPNSHAPIARASRHPPAHDRTPNAPHKGPRFGWPLPAFNRCAHIRAAGPRPIAVNAHSRPPARRIMAQMPTDNRYKARAATQICRAPHLTRVSKRDKLNLIILH